MTNEIKQKLLKEVKSMEEAKSLRDSCYDYFYKKFGDNWEEQFYKKHLKDLKSDCAYLNLKLRLKQHEETSKAKDEEFIKILDEIEKNNWIYADMDEAEFWITSTITQEEANIRANHTSAIIEEIKQRIKQK